MYSNKIRSALAKSISDKPRRGRPVADLAAATSKKKKKFEKHPLFFSDSSDDAPDSTVAGCSQQLEEEPIDFETVDQENDFIEDDFDFMGTTQNDVFEENNQSSEDDMESVSDHDEIFQEYFWTSANQHSTLTVNEAATLIISLQRKFRISDAAIDAMIKLIGICIKPIGNVAFSSFYKAKKIVQNAMVEKYGQVTSSIRTICEQCYSDMDEKVCQNAACQKNGKRQNAVQYFTCSIEKQVLALATNHINSILSNLDNAKKVAATGKVTDIMNGAFYQSLGENPVNNTLWISLQMNADGARPKYACTGSLWPCIAVIAELPQKIRYSFENCIVFAMWHGNSKPEWKNFLNKPLMELEQLQNDGLACQIGKNITRIKVRLLSTVCDLPARASILEHNQWNGAFGCMDCLEPGKRIDGTYIWPFAFSSPEKSSQWYRDIYRHLKTLKDRGTVIKEPIMGVKGESVLKRFIDFGQQNPYDFMHQSYRGVVDQILSAILDPAKRGHKKQWKISKGGAFQDLDNLQLQIHFPHDFQRTIKPLDTWKKSKASELKNNMLYTLVPCSKKIFLSRGKDAIDFWHWVLLYNEISRRMTQDEIPVNDLPVLERLIKTWQLLVSTFLGEKNSTYNIHATKHMPKYVRLFGPVQNYSAFGFEGFIGLFVRYVSSAFGSLNQIAERLALQQYCSRWISNAKFKSSAFSKLVETFEDNRPFRHIVDDLYVMDEVKISIDDNVIHQNYLISDDSKAFARARKGRIVLHSLAYTRRKTTCSYIAKFIINGTTYYGEINQFIVNGSNVYAYVQMYDIVSGNIASDSTPSNSDLKKLWDENLYGSFFKTVSQSGKYSLLDLQNVITLCIIIRVDQLMYLTELAHSYEHN